MDKPGNYEAAKQYVDDQLETMKEHGTPSKLSNEEYERLIEKVASATVSAAATATAK